MELASKLTKEIYEKYPKVWELIKIFILDFGDNIIRKNTDGQLYIGICNSDILFWYNSIIPFIWLYSLMDKFFNNYEIDLSLLYFIEKAFIIKKYITGIEKDYQKLKDRIKIKEEIKYQVILKACKTLDYRFTERLMK